MTAVVLDLQEALPLQSLHPTQPGARSCVTLFWAASGLHFQGAARFTLAWTARSALGPDVQQSPFRLVEVAGR